jgi:type I restriction enzyme R subunit
MKIESQNFEPLRNLWPELASLGGFAERYSHSDPPSALIKLRIFCEQIVKELYQRHDVSFWDRESLRDLLVDDRFSSLLPKVVLNKLHLLRKAGNKAAHGGQPSVTDAIYGLREAWDLGRWLFLTYAGGNAKAFPNFREPVPTRDAGRLEREKKEAEKRAAEQELQLQELLREREELRAQADEAQRSEAELNRMRAAGIAAAQALDFDEETTRIRLIDRQLMEAGWKLDPAGGNTEEVSRETEVPDQPTHTGLGYADYVLWDDSGLPLAVIEAKKTAESPEKGQTQARMYADGLEKRHGRRPVVFYTNGFEIFIWDDAGGYPPRSLFGFYSKDSLEYLVRRRTSRKPLDSVEPDANIIGDRLYQIQAIQQVCERFSANFRKALLVQATGTGKTRVAIALTDVLLRANWCVRVLFLCDRRELRDQARDAFKEFTSEPFTIVTAKTAKDRNKRIYIGTYPAMMKVFQTFDVGFFDLIIADESHRSIYNRYRELFKWFDCLQIGLTATPVDKIHRNTFKLFECEAGNPTHYYALEDAIEDGYLVPFEVYKHSTDFLRRGIKYDQLTEEQKEQLEDDNENPELFNFEAKDLDKRIFNRDTNRIILQNLMEKGIRDETGQRPGKSIIFARSHKHAVLLAQLFNELYPQYAGEFCQVIDNYDSRAGELIKEFKNPAHTLTIAISVDMLDTGVDIPEVVNLVFAKPVFSQVKFWQMIGRGTRLRRNLFGSGKHKSKFLIFDHWGNFERFEVSFRETDPAPSKSIMQQVFEARLQLAETALEKGNPDCFQNTLALIRAAIHSLPDKTIAVREKWKEKHKVLADGVLEHFAPATLDILRMDIAPLMQWINIRDHLEAYQFDCLIAGAQTELLRGSGRFEDFKDQIQDKVARLDVRLNQVLDKMDVIKKVRSAQYWAQVDVDGLETLRVDLRGIIHNRRKGGEPPSLPKTVDVTDGDVRFEQHQVRIHSMDMQLYRKLVAETLEKLFDTSPVLQKIRRGEPVGPKDLESLVSLVLTQNPDVNLELLREFYPDSAVPLDFIIRTIIGMEAEAVESRFAEFARKYSQNSRQTHFLRLLKNHIFKYGTIDLEKLYEEPFTTIDSDGPDGVFVDEAQIDELFQILETFQPRTGAQPSA